MKDNLFGKQLVILGLARQGKALARFAVNVGARVIISDLRGADNLCSDLGELADLPVEYVFGEHPMRLLEGTDIIAVSGGVPIDSPILEASRRKGIDITNDSLEFIKRVSASTVGITGSAGKTTTTALTGAMAKMSGRYTWVGGNIGRPLISQLDQIHPNDIVIQELSSFQLELWDRSPQVAAVLNITPNHLDRHKTMANYREAKSNILRYQSPEDTAVLSADDAGAMTLREIVSGRLRLFSQTMEVEDGAFVRQGKIWMRDGLKEWFVCDLEGIPLRGRHNVLNVMAASVLADSFGVKAEAMREAISAFPGVEHRLELVRTIGGVQFINDSIATAPERAIAAIDSFDEPLVLLAGGQDKDMIWGNWTKQVNDRVKAVVLFGELAEMLEEQLGAVRNNGSGPSGPLLKRTETLAEAVLIAADLAVPGDVVLLSPGGTSYDAFVDFAERGVTFRKLVNQLAR